MVGIENKQGFEALLVEIEASGEDPMLFMREELMETIYQEIIDILWSKTEYDNAERKFCSKPY